VRRSDSAWAFAAAFGHRLGEIGEQHGEPQPHDDLEGEREVLAAGGEVAQENDSGQRRHDLDHEHHGVLDHERRVELCERRPCRRSHDPGIPQGGILHVLARI